MQLDPDLEPKRQAKLSCILKELLEFSEQERVEKKILITFTNLHLQKNWQSIVSMMAKPKVRSAGGKTN